jgi:hypothetical protein
VLPVTAVRGATEVWPFAQRTVIVVGADELVVRVMTKCHSLESHEYDVRFWTGTPLGVGSGAGDGLGDGDVDGDGLGEVLGDGLGLVLGFGEVLGDGLGLVLGFGEDVPGHGPWLTLN